VSEQRDVVSVRQGGSLAPASGRVGASRERLRAPRRRLVERSRAIVETRRRVGAPSRRLVARKGRQGASCDVSVVASGRLAAPSGSPGVRGRRRRASTERPVAPRRARVDGGGAKTGRAEELVAEVGDAARDAEVRVDDGACNRQEALPQE
jgi:hypothetical protein